jgi:hypothetical protein
MILVRTNPKVAIAIVLLTLATSIFTVWMVTRTTDRAAQQGIALQREATKSVSDAIKQSNAAVQDAQADIDAAQVDAAKVQKDVAADVQAQIDAAQKQIQAAGAN